MLSQDSAYTPLSDEEARTLQDTPRDPRGSVSSHGQTCLTTDSHEQPCSLADALPYAAEEPAPGRVVLTMQGFSDDDSVEQSGMENNEYTDQDASAPQPQHGLGQPPQNRSSGTTPYETTSAREIINDQR